MQITNYTAEIKINGTTLPDWSGFEVSTQVGEAETKFSVDLGRPLNIGDNDTISIRDGFGSDLSYLIQDKKIEGNSGNFFQFQISGIGSDISRKAVSRGILYVNENWLSEVARGYVVKDGIVYSRNPGQSPIRRNGVSIYRLMMNGFPGNNIKDNDFECVLQKGITHHDIVQDIASRAGYSVVINTPNLPVRKTIFIDPKETYWGALAKLLSLWNPMIFINGTTIYVVDSGGDSQNKRTKGSLVFTEDSFQGYEWRIDRASRVIDHLIIRGPNTRYTYTGNQRQIRKATRTETTLSGDTITEQFVSTTSVDLSDFRYMYLTLDTTALKSEVRTVTKVINPFDPDDRVTLREEREMYNYNDEMFKKITTDYKYASWNIPIGSKTVECALIGLTAAGLNEVTQNSTKMKFPAKWVWKRMKETEISFDDYLEDTGQVETTEKTYGLVVYEKVSERVNGETVYSYEGARELDTYTQTGGYLYCEISRNPNNTWGEDCSGVPETPDGEEPVYPPEELVPESSTSEEPVTEDTKDTEEQAGADNAEDTQDPSSGEDSGIAIVGTVKDPEYGFETRWDLVRNKSTTFDITSPSLLRKNVTVTTYFPAVVVKSTSEDIPLPKRQRGGGVLEKVWDFYNVGGTPYLRGDGDDVPAGTWHPVHEIESPDVTHDAEATSIAARYFQARTASITEISIKTMVPLIGSFVGSTLTLPTCIKRFFNWNTNKYENISIAGGTYWIISQKRICKYTGDVGESSRGLEVYDVLGLRSYYG